MTAVNLSVAFWIVAFLAVVAGVLLVYVPAGLIVAGILLGVAGWSQLEVPERPEARR